MQIHISKTDVNIEVMWNIYTHYKSKIFNLILKTIQSQLQTLNAFYQRM